MHIAYAHDLTDNDPFVAISEEAFVMFSKTMFPGAFVVNDLPIREYTLYAPLT